MITTLVHAVAHPSGTGQPSEEELSRPDPSKVLAQQAIAKWTLSTDGTQRVVGVSDVVSHVSPAIQLILEKNAEALAEMLNIKKE